MSSDLLWIQGRRRSRDERADREHRRSRSRRAESPRRSRREERPKSIERTREEEAVIENGDGPKRSSPAEELNTNASR